MVITVIVSRETGLHWDIFQSECSVEKSTMVKPHVYISSERKTFKLCKKHHILNVNRRFLLLLLLK